MNGKKISDLAFEVLKETAENRWSTETALIGGTEGRTRFAHVGAAQALAKARSEIGAWDRVSPLPLGRDACALLVPAIQRVRAQAARRQAADVGFKSLIALTLVFACDEALDAIPFRDLVKTPADPIAAASDEARAAEGLETPTA